MRSWRLQFKRRLVELKRLSNAGEIFLFIQILCFATAVPLLMRLKLPRLSRLLEPSRNLPPPSSEQMKQITNLVEIALQLGSPLIRSNCLTRSLTRYYFLRRAGLEVALHFGMGHPEDKFAAHAWLVCAGEPFLEVTDPRPIFATIYSFPDRRKLD